MKILHLSKSDLSGGAAKAAYRIHLAQRAAGLDSRMLVKNKSSNDDSVFQPTCQPETALEAESILQKFLQEAYVDNNRSSLSNTAYSINWLADSVVHLPEVLQADILHLHWTAGFVGVREIGRLLDLGKPVFWTLHDQWAFTGGYHYDFGAGGYSSDDFQQKCPQLAADPLFLSAKLTAHKSTVFGRPNLHVCGPSHWITDCAQRSLVFQQSEIRTIPNPCDETVFHPRSKVEMRAILGLPKDDFLILFSGASGREKRKGVADAIAAVTQLAGKLPDRKITLISVGRHQSLLEKTPFPARQLGNLTSEEDMAQVYAACDFFLHPSLEDNFPNGIIEAQLCGIPTIAYAVGGVSEMVADGINGYLVPRGDVEALSEKLRLMLEGKANLGKWEDPNWLTHDFLPATCARKYLDYYQSMLEKNVPPPAKCEATDPLQIWAADELLRLAAFNHAKSSTVQQETTRKLKETRDSLEKAQKKLAETKEKSEAKIHRLELELKQLQRPNFRSRLGTLFRG